MFIQEYNDAIAIYHSDFDGNRFEVQLVTLQEYCANLDRNVCIRSVSDTLRNLRLQIHLREAFKLMKLVLVLSQTNATNERTMIYLRSTMKQSRLNHLMIFSAYKNQLVQLDLTKIVSDFKNKNDACKHISDKFNQWLTSICIAYFKFSLV